MNIIHTADILLHDIINIMSNYPDLQSIQDELQSLKQRLKEPLRVAVVGVIKSGKSTLLNALMGEKLLKTGENETTYNVTWFKYGNQPELQIHMKDGRIMKEEVAALYKWTTHTTSNPHIKDVDYVVYKHPNPILKKIELIDTPGLKSSYMDDAENTLEFLGLDVAALSDRTTAEGSNADAIIYAFHRGISQDENEMLQLFQNPLFANASPINAIGVLTKTDMYWGRHVSNPLSEAKKITGRYKQIDEVRKLLYDIVPVSGQMVESHVKITQEQFQTLQNLSQLDDANVKRLFKGVHFFCDYDFPDIEVSPEERAAIYETIGLYGAFVAIQKIKAGCSTLEELQHHLYIQSGMENLYSKITQHFGNRSFIIKFQFILSRIRTLCQSAMITCKHNQEIRKKIDYMINRCDEMVAKEHVFREMDVLQAFYNGHLNMTESESQELLEITGEYGSHCEAKLGVDNSHSIRQLAEIAHKKSVKWLDKIDDIFSTRKDEEAAKILARSCEIMYYHLSCLAGYHSTSEKMESEK